MLLRNVKTVAMIALIAASAVSQNGSISLQSIINGPNHVALLQVNGPPQSFFDVYYALDLGLTGLTHLTSGVLDGSGQWTAAFQVQGNMQLPCIWIGAVVHPPGGVPPFIAGPIAAAAAAALVPCTPTGTMTLDPAICMVSLSATVCPGDIVEIKVNGVAVVTSGPAGANGIVVLGAGGMCGLPAGTTITATRNGAPFIGPIIT